MDNNKLEQANKLQERIKRVKQILEQWKDATGLFQDQAAVALPNTRGITYLPVTDETFTILRAINITYWTEALAETEKEFNEL